MQIEGGTDGTVFRFRVPVFNLSNAASSGHRAASLRNVRANAGLVVMELIIAIAVKHAVDLEDIGVGIRPAEFVASAVEAENELLANTTALYGRIGLHSGVWDGLGRQALRLGLCFLFTHLKSGKYYRKGSRR